MLLTFLLGGCSTVGLAYSQAPALLYYWLDDYVDFDKTQAPLVKERLNALHTWHRTEELPKLADTLKGLQTLAAGPVTSAQLCNRFQQISVLLMAPANHATADMAGIASSLTARQMQNLDKALRKRNEKWQDEWLQISKEAALDKRLDQWVDRVESFYGDVSQADKAAFRLALISAGWNPEAAYRESVRRQRDLVQVIQKLRGENLPASQAQREIRQWLERNQQSADPDYRAYNERITQTLCNALADFHQNASASQRNRLIKTLQNYEREAREQALPSGKGNSG